MINCRTIGTVQQTRQGVKRTSTSLLGPLRIIYTVLNSLCLTVIDHHVNCSPRITMMTIFTLIAFSLLLFLSVKCTNDFFENIHAPLFSIQSKINANMFFKSK